ncbi:MAG TPA: P1 family peptidase [Vicinamibacteria bacterium]|nr:P1 family peptidase [Vicinamibacteria bacterium]
MSRLAPVLLVTCSLGLGAPAFGQGGLTAVEGIRVGHHTLSEAPTGCTVVLAGTGAVAAVDVRGGAPGTRETDLLSPENMVQEAHAIVLSGGSAFGLDAATGVMRYLEEKGIGFDVGVAKVPIVPAAILFDLGLSAKAGVRPGADCGYKAAAAADAGPISEGSVGAGAGATVGKLGGLGMAMKGGIGTWSFSLGDGLVVAALIAVNSVGDVVDPDSGRIVAGVRKPDGGFADAREIVRAGLPTRDRRGENTTIGVVATNARLTQAQATKVAQMAQDGLSRTIYPVHTPFDGDTIFVLATGTLEGDVNLLSVGALAADATAQAVLRAVREAEGVAGFPSVRDLEPKGVKE